MNYTIRAQDRLCALCEDVSRGGRRERGGVGSTGAVASVVVRTLRDAGGIDLQQLVQEDMKSHYVLSKSVGQEGV